MALYDEDRQILKLRTAVHYTVHQLGIFFIRPNCKNAIRHFTQKNTLVLGITSNFLYMPVCMCVCAYACVYVTHQHRAGYERVQALPCRVRAADGTLHQAHRFPLQTAQAPAPQTHQRPVLQAHAPPATTSRMSTLAHGRLVPFGGRGRTRSHRGSAACPHLA